VQGFGASEQDILVDAGPEVRAPLGFGVGAKTTVGLLSGAVKPAEWYGVVAATLVPVFGSVLADVGKETLRQMNLQPVWGAILAETVTAAFQGPSGIKWGGGAAWNSPLALKEYFKRVELLSALHRMVALGDEKLLKSFAAGGLSTWAIVMPKYALAIRRPGFGSWVYPHGPTDAVPWTATDIAWAADRQADQMTSAGQLGTKILAPKDQAIVDFLRALAKALRARVEAAQKGGADTALMRAAEIRALILAGLVRAEVVTPTYHLTYRPPKKYNLNYSPPPPKPAKKPEAGDRRDQPYNLNYRRPAPPAKESSALAWWIVGGVAAASGGLYLWSRRSPS